mmetsp:Transcript_12340/g.40345  ORF Transcript_12340/g.40345 Transcript_12340/m.40345 type:complete len:237 (+) Transcript_12340:1686-2396(+)
MLSDFPRADVGPEGSDVLGVEVGDVPRQDVRVTARRLVVGSGGVAGRREDGKVRRHHAERVSISRRLDADGVEPRPSVVPETHLEHHREVPGLLPLRFNELPSLHLGTPVGAVRKQRRQPRRRPFESLIKRRVPRTVMQHEPRLRTRQHVRLEPSTFDVHRVDAVAFLDSFEPVSPKRRPLRRELAVAKDRRPGRPAREAADRPALQKAQGVSHEIGVRKQAPQLPPALRQRRRRR